MLPVMKPPPSKSERMEIRKLWETVPYLAFMCLNISADPII
ncbi:hypothetical protein WBP07_04785 [Novosphingobium sp. BL-8A]